MTTGDKTECEDCVIGKIKMKNIAKKNKNRSNICGQRLYEEISYNLSPSYSGSKYLILVEDESTRIKWSMFVKRRYLMTQKNHID